VLSGPRRTAANGPLLCSWTAECSNVRRDVNAAAICSLVKVLRCESFVGIGSCWIGGWLARGVAGVAAALAIDEGAVDTGVRVVLLRGCVLLGVVGLLRFCIGDEIAGDTDLFTDFRWMGDVLETGVLTERPLSCPPIAFRYDW
jgi:hypothetical protein